MSEAVKPGIEFYGGYQVYSESGVDLTMLRRNLERSVEERLEAVARNLPFLEALRTGSADTLQAKRPTMLDTAEFLRQLHAAQVNYVLIGGFAMIAHGSTYQTKDLDICYSRTASNLASLVAALGPLHPILRGAPAGLPFRFDVATIQAGLNFTLTTDLGDIDILGEVSGIGRYDEALAQAEAKPMYGLTVHVLSLDGLIAAKKAAGRVKDRLHLLELEELKKLRDSAQP